MGGGGEKGTGISTEPQSLHPSPALAPTVFIKFQGIKSNAFKAQDPRFEAQHSNDPF